MLNGVKCMWTWQIGRLSCLLWWCRERKTFIFCILLPSYKPSLANLFLIYEWWYTSSSRTSCAFPALEYVSIILYWYINPYVCAATVNNTSGCMCRWFKRNYDSRNIELIMCLFWKLLCNGKSLHCACRCHPIWATVAH